MKSPQLELTKLGIPLLGTYYVRLPCRVFQRLLQTEVEENICQTDIAVSGATVFRFHDLSEQSQVAFLPKKTYKKT